MTSLLDCHALPNLHAARFGKSSAGMGGLLWLYRDVEERARGGPIPAWLVYAFGVLALVNFASFVAISLYIGGDALNGHQTAGHYFLSNKGKLTEVSRTVFKYSQWHALSVFVTHSLAMLVGCGAFRKRRVPR